MRKEMFEFFSILFSLLVVSLTGTFIIVSILDIFDR